MPLISQKNRDKITEQVLAYLFSVAPEPRYTVQIARELARDEEFIKSLLVDLEKRNLVVCITKNALGLDLIRRQRWRLSNQAFTAYKQLHARTQ